MQNSDRELSPKARRRIIFINVAAPIGACATVWILYASAALFDIDLAQLLRRNRGPRDLDPAQVYLWIAIVVTVICLGIAWRSSRRALYLANHGIPVVGEVVKFGRISVHGMVRVDCEYKVDGKSYRHSLSCLQEIAERYASGDEPLELVYDPQRPKRAMLMSDVFPVSRSAADRSQDS